MLETATSIELQNLTQHLVRQPGPAAILAEFVHHLRASGIRITSPADLASDLSARDIDTREPIVIHLPGRSNRAVLIGVGFEPPETPTEDFGLGPMMRPSFGADVVQEFDNDGHPRSIYGQGALTTAAPLAIGAWLVKELRQLGDDLPGHVILAVAPEASTGGEAFEKAGQVVADIVAARRLRPLLALIPGRLRPGASVRKRHHIVVTSGSAGLFTVQLFIAGQTAAPGARFRALDPVALASALITEFTTGDASRSGPLSRVPPAVVTAHSTGLSPAAGWPTPWAAVRLSFFVDQPDPQELLAHVNTTCETVFQKHIVALNAQWGRQRRQGGKDVATGRHLTWQSLVLAYHELKRTCRYEMPPIEPPPADVPASEQLQHAQEQALRRVRFAWQHSPHIGTPMVVVSLAPPVLPPFQLDADDEAVVPVLKKTASEYQALRSKSGLLVDAWQRLALTGWNGRYARTAQDDSPLADQPTGFGLRTGWHGWPLLGFGPAGRDAGTRSESVDVEPSFTRLPEFLRTLIVRLLAQDERPTVLASTLSRLRRLSARLGFSRREAPTDDSDDAKLFPGMRSAADESGDGHEGESSDDHPASRVGKTDETASSDGD